MRWTIYSQRRRTGHTGDTPNNRTHALMQVKETLKNVQLDDKSSSVEARHQLDIGFELQFIGISLGLKLGQWCRLKPILQEAFSCRS